MRRYRFKGRSAIHELLELDDEIREMLLSKKPGSEIRKKAKDKGMAFLRDSALERVRAGIYDACGRSIRLRLLRRDGKGRDQESASRDGGVSERE